MREPAVLLHLEAVIQSPTMGHGIRGQECAPTQTHGCIITTAGEAVEEIHGEMVSRRKERPDDSIDAEELAWWIL
jgi:hypothetical protein